MVTSFEHLSNQPICRATNRDAWSSVHSCGRIPSTRNPPPAWTSDGGGKMFWGKSGQHASIRRSRWPTRAASRLLEGTSDKPVVPRPGVVELIGRSRFRVPSRPCTFTWSTHWAVCVSLLGNLVRRALLPGAPIGGGRGDAEQTRPYSKLRPRQRRGKQLLSPKSAFTVRCAEKKRGGHERGFEGCAELVPLSFYRIRR